MNGDSFLTKSWFEIFGYDFALVNLLAVVAIVASAYGIVQHVRKNYRKGIVDRKIKIEGKNLHLFQIVKQTVFVVSFFLVIWSFRINNDDASLSDFLNYTLLTIGTFTLKLYNVFLLGILIVAAKVGVNLFRVYLHNLGKQRQSLDHSTQYVVVQLAKYVIYVIVLIVMLRSTGVDMAVLLTGSAALLVGVGFALQDFFKDVISGLIILMEGTMKVGDIIEIGGQGSGKFVVRITQVNLRTTKIETRDGSVYIVPNSKLTQEYVNSWSFGNDETRFFIPIALHYGVDLPKAEEIMTRSVQKHEKCLQSREVFVRLLNYGPDGLELDVVFWAEQTWWIERYKSEMRKEIYKNLSEAGIGIPYPQRTLHMAPPVEQAPPFAKKTEAPE